MEKKQFAQGDILFVQLLFEPDLALHEAPDRVIARGEKSGHAHVLEGPGALLEEGPDSPYSIPARRHFLRADGEVTVRHEEHPRLRLERGLYEIKRQRTYDYKTPKRPRSVVD